MRGCPRDYKETSSIMLTSLFQIVLEKEDGWEPDVTVRDTEFTSNPHAPRTDTKEERRKEAESAAETGDPTVNQLKTKDDEEQEHSETEDDNSEDSNSSTWTTDDINEDLWFDDYLYDLTDKKLDEPDECSSDDEGAHNNDGEKQDLTGEVSDDNTGTQAAGCQSTQKTETDTKSEEEISPTEFKQYSNASEEARAEKPEMTDNNESSDDDSYPLQMEKMSTETPQEGVKPKQMTEIAENREEKSGRVEVQQESNASHVAAEEATLNTAEEAKLNTVQVQTLTYVEIENGVSAKRGKTNYFKRVETVPDNKQ